MSEEQADELRSSRTASRLECMGQPMMRTREIFFVCVRYGSTYGAALGAASGLILGSLSLIGPAGGLVIGAFAGALCGAIGGGIFGFVGSMIPGRAGWILAGLLGGAVFPAWYGSVPAGKEGWDAFVILVSATSVLLGGFLGHALNQGLRGGNSTLPGVQHLAAIILDRDRTPERLADDAEPDERPVPHEA